MEHAYAARRAVYVRMGKADRGDVHAAPITEAAIRGFWLEYRRRMGL